MITKSEREQAMREYKDAQEALRRRTAALRALREERDARVVPLAKATAERRRAKQQAKPSLSAWLDLETKSGRNT